MEVFQDRLDVFVLSSLSVSQSLLLGSVRVEDGASGIPPADHGVAHPARCLKNGFGKAGVTRPYTGRDSQLEWA